VTGGSELGDLLRPLAPQVLGALLRRYGRLDECEDAVQEALLAAAVQWPGAGVPANPYGWLVTVATRRLTDWARSDAARRRREEAYGAPADQPSPADQPGPPDHDDTLALLFLCCHPALSPPSQIALTLRAVAGLSTVEIARAFLVPEATVAQRISRAKRAIRDAGATFTMPPAQQRAQRLRAVLQVLYLMFNEGYATSAGTSLQRPDLTADAVRLTRLLHRLLPGDSEVAGLLALLLLTDSRRDARTGPAGSLIPLEEQDRARWDRDLVAEGTALVAETLAGTRELGPYQLQAAIAAVHAEAPRVEQTDWPQILALYRLLESLGPANPVVVLNRIVAMAMVDGPRAGLVAVAELATDERMTRNHRLHAVRAHLLEMAGEPVAALESYRAAARYATNVPEKRYLEGRAAALASHSR
jgi:RNA polymerase sigma factor (sigma-70 family)